MLINSLRKRLRASLTALGSGSEVFRKLRLYVFLSLAFVCHSVSALAGTQEFANEVYQTCISRALPHDDHSIIAEKIEDICRCAYYTVVNNNITDSTPFTTDPILECISTVLPNIRCDSYTSCHRI
jgi:hypothetical protein